MRVYLAGPITGLTFEDSEDWRRRIASMFFSYNLHNEVTVLSPLRGKSYLKDAGKLGHGDYSTIHPLSSDRGIVTRDLNDVRNADLLIVNVLGAETASPGTCMEIGAAAVLQIPTILVMEAEGNPHDRHMVRGAVGYRVDNLEDAFLIGATVLGFDVRIEPKQEKAPAPERGGEEAPELEPWEVTMLDG